MNAEQQVRFGKWWFINGGHIHGMWKKRKYSAIRDQALTLPKAAWEAGWNAGWNAALAAQAAAGSAVGNCPDCRSDT